MSDTEPSDILHMTLSPDEASVLAGSSRSPMDYVALDLPVMSVELGKDANGNEFARVLLPIPKGMLKPMMAGLFGADNKPIQQSLTISGLSPHLHMVLRKDALSEGAVRELDANLRLSMQAMTEEDPT